MNPTGRFSSRVADYVRYRPSYPPGVVETLARDCGLTPNSTVADIGSGTGFLAEQFLRFGCEVVGVEPNAPMRGAGEEYLAAYPRFRSVDGRAEATGLPDGSVDLVSAGQAFHWFEADPARAEFIRILRPSGWVALVWNDRRDDVPFCAAYEALLLRSASDYHAVKAVDSSRINTGVIREFLRTEPRHARFNNVQRFDLPGLMGRLESSSYAPAKGTEAHEQIMQELTRLWHEYQRDGLVDFEYYTNLYYGQPDEPRL